MANVFPLMVSTQIDFFLQVHKLCRVPFTALSASSPFSYFIITLRKCLFPTNQCSALYIMWQAVPRLRQDSVTENCLWPELFVRNKHKRVGQDHRNNCDRKANRPGKRLLPVELAGLISEQMSLLNSAWLHLAPDCVALDWRGRGCREKYPIPTWQKMPAASCLSPGICLYVQGVYKSSILNMGRPVIIYYPVWGTLKESMTS